jgi:hypothetical protein
MKQIGATVVFVPELSAGDMVHGSDDGKSVGT